MKNIGLMSNMPYAEHAFHLIKDEDVALGLHVNLILGTPCARTEQIPSLVDKQGQLLSSRLRRNEMRKGIDGFVYEDTRREVEAQIERFISLCGNCRIILMRMRYVRRHLKKQSVMQRMPMVFIYRDIKRIPAGKAFRRILQMKIFIS